MSLSDIQTGDVSPTVQKPHRWLFFGLRGKLIIPYVILTLALAMVGTYVITRLVTSTLRERFINQIFEASRVSADNVVRRERAHLENLRLMAYTQGMAQGLTDKNAQTLEELLLPLALNNKVEIVAAVGTDSQCLLFLGLDPQSNQYLHSEGIDLSAFEPVSKVLSGSSDTLGDKFIGLLQTNYGLALVTSAPVLDDGGKLAGVLLVGTRLETLLAETKSQALADVILLDSDKHLLATTLAKPDEGYSALEEAASSANPLEAQTNDFRLYNRDFQIVYSPWKIRQQVLGWMGVVLPSSYVVSTEAKSRNTFSIIFALGTTAVFLIGYLLSQSIARPILRLRTMTQAVAGGNLDQHTGLSRSDEIGDLATAFDSMTLQLRQRTEEAERLYAESVQRNKELAEINARLQTMQIQLIQSEKLAAVGQLTAGIVHDVKNPLAVIKGLAEFLKDEPAITAETQKQLNVIRDSADRANRIVTDLLKFARQSRPVFQAHDLRETIEASLRLTAYLAREAHIEIVTQLPEKTILVAHDSQQVEQVLINLIHNAIQAMPNHGVLSVRLEQVDKVASIAIQDTGVGIPPENLRRIFDPFFTTKPEGQGTGLGLSVSYGIIANHRGSIEVASEVGKGTTFTILLPVEQPQL